MFLTDGFLTALAGNSRHSLECSYSLWSGLTGRVIVGHSGDQEISVGFEFGESNSFLYDPAECPPSVFACFDPVSSQSFIALSQTSGSDELVGISDRFPFTLVKERQEPPYQFRDVAGMLGAGKHSTVFGDKKLVLTERLAEGTVSMTVLSDTHSNPRARTPTLEMGSFWAFGAELSFNAAPIYEGPVVFDPSVQDILVPFSFRHRFPGAIALGDRLYADCSTGMISASSLSLSLTISGGLEAPLSASQLVYPGESCFVVLADGSQVRFCPTRILFVPSEHIIIGRVLLRSVTSVSLNYKDSTIEIAPLMNRKLRSAPFTDPSPLVPLYEYPTLTLSGEVPKILLKRSRNGGLALLHSHIRQVAPGKECWEFFRTGPEQTLEDIQIPGTFGRVYFANVGNTAASVRLLDNEGSNIRYTVSVHKHMHGVSICRTVVQNTA
jgi:hypothetical protein